MKTLCCAFLFIISVPSQAQTDLADEYRIVSLIIDSLITALDFQYYYPVAPVNASLEDYQQFPDSTFSRFDPDTYDDISRTGREWDSILAGQFRAEEELYRLRTAGHPAVLLIGTFRNIYQYHDINLYSRGSDTLPHTGIDIRQLAPYDWDNSNLTTSHDFVFQEYGTANLDRYKYVIKGMVHLSNVIFNPGKDHALIQVGYHHRVYNGNTGAGMLILLSRESGDWKMIGAKGLWEE